MASPSSDVQPQNERDHIHKFSPLPQSEGEDDHNNHEDQPLSISMESITTTPTGPRPTISDFYSDEIFSVSARTCQMTQDLLGLTMLILLIFLTLYRRLGSPKEDPVPPIFTLNSMYISNFTTGTEGLTATWDTKFTKMLFLVTSSYPFYLDQGEFVKLHLKFTTTGRGWEDDDQPFVENRLVEEIGKDRVKDGSLSFGMQMKVEAIYYGETWVSDVVMNPHCENLTVQFVPNKNSGRLVDPNRNFSVPIQWKLFSFFDEVSPHKLLKIDVLLITGYRY
ncbi:hypothetical protein SESBI_49669 [Sesbania bispinosa]|nr:hypothetical protein SESBI_49669 [Sesbania bispinosa]